MSDSWMELPTRWEVPPIVTILLALTWVVCLRGWLLLRRSRPGIIPLSRCACFSAGILSLFVAVASPLDTFRGSLLFMHMMEHLVLMSVAPPLLVLGSPMVPLLRGLPGWSIRGCLSRLFRTRLLRRLGGSVTWSQSASIPNGRGASP